MKLRFSTPVIAAIAALLLLASCSKSNKQGKLIPKDAGFVLHINSKSIFEKINIAEVKQTDWYKQMMEQLDKDSTTPVFVKRLHENMASSGLDSTADIIFFGQKDSMDRMNLVLEGGLRDSKAFENFLKNIYPDGSVAKDGDIQTMAIMDHAILTWNNDRFIMGIKTPAMGGMYGMPRRDEESGPGGPRLYNDTSNATIESTGLSDITSFCKNLYSLKESNSLGSDEKFTGLMNTEGDVHGWVNIEKLVGGSSLPMGMMSMIKLDAFTNGNISTYTASFDKGKMSLKVKSFVGKDLDKILDKYSGGSINTDMIKNIPSENIDGVLAFHFKPGGLKELVKLSGMDGLLDLMLIRQGFSVDDFVKANKGDLMIVFTDLQMKKDSLSFEGADKKMRSDVYDKPDVKVLFSAAIGDKDAFNKLIAAGKDVVGTESKVHYKTNANYFAIGTDATMVDQYLAGGKHEPAFLNKLSGNAIGGFVDIQKILKAMPPDPAKDSLAKLMWDESVKMWESATLTGGDYSGGGINQVFEFNLLDKNTNSLKQLFQYTMTMSSFEQQKMKKMEANNKIEAVTKIEPPVISDTARVVQPRHTTRKTTGNKKK